MGHEQGFMGEIVVAYARLLLMPMDQYQVCVCDVCDGHTFEGSSGALVE